MPSLVTCPACFHPFDAPVMRGRKCPNCKVRLVIERNQEGEKIGLQTARQAADREFDKFRAMNHQRLLEYRREKVSHVRIFATLDGTSFPECLDSHDQVMGIDEAVRSTPVPHRATSDDGKQRCACVILVDQATGRAWTPDEIETRRRIVTGTSGKKGRTANATATPQMSPALKTALVEAASAGAVLAAGSLWFGASLTLAAGVGLFGFLTGLGQRKGKRKKK